MKTTGIVILILGLAGLILFGVQAINNSEAINLFGMEIAISTANWTPVIISGIVTIVGIIMINSAKQARS